MKNYLLNTPPSIEWREVCLPDGYIANEESVDLLGSSWIQVVHRDQENDRATLMEAATQKRLFIDGDELVKIPLKYTDYAIAEGFSHITIGDYTQVQLLDTNGEKRAVFLNPKKEILKIDGQEVVSHTYVGHMLGGSDQGAVYKIDTEFGSRYIAESGNILDFGTFDIERIDMQFSDKNLLYVIIGGKGYYYDKTKKDLLKYKEYLVSSISEKMTHGVFGDIYKITIDDENKSRFFVNSENEAILINAEVVTDIGESWPHGIFGTIYQVSVENRRGWHYINEKGEYLMHEGKHICKLERPIKTSFGTATRITLDTGEAIYIDSEKKAIDIGTSAIEEVTKEIEEHDIFGNITELIVRDMSGKRYNIYMDKAQKIIKVDNKLVIGVGDSYPSIDIFCVLIIDNNQRYRVYIDKNKRLKQIGGMFVREISQVALKNNELFRVHLGDASGNEYVKYMNGLGELFESVEGEEISTSEYGFTNLENTGVFQVPTNTKQRCIDARNRCIARINGKEILSFDQESNGYVIKFMDETQRWFSKEDLENRFSRSHQLVSTNRNQVKEVMNQV